MDFLSEKDDLNEEVPPASLGSASYGNFKFNLRNSTEYGSIRSDHIAKYVRAYIFLMFKMNRTCGIPAHTRPCSAWVPNIQHIGTISKRKISLMDWMPACRQRLGFGPHVCCSSSNGNEEPGLPDDVEKRVSGLTKSQARALLKAWKEAGANDPQALKRMVKQRGSNRSVLALRQLAVDLGSAVVAWYSGAALAESKVSVPAEFLLYTLAIYLTINATIDIFDLIAVGIATRKYSGQSAVLLEAVRNLADEETGFEFVDKARRAVVTVEVLKALDDILEDLKRYVEKGIGESRDEADFFRDLGAYLVLANAAKNGFSFEDDGEGLDGRVIGEVAAEFALADKDDDGFIDVLEFQALGRKTVPAMSMEEAEAALSLLDSSKDGVVDFKEFLSWFANQKK